MRVSVNFASREYLIVRRAYAAVSVGIILLVALFWVQYSSYADNSARVEEARGMLVRTSEENKGLEERYKEISRDMSPSLIDSTEDEARFASEVINGKSFSWTLFLNRFEELVPEGVGIQTISPNFSNLDISISGNAKDMGALLDFIDNLTASEYFADLPPNFKSTQTTVDKDTDRKAEVFNLSIRYYPYGDRDRT